MIKEYNPVVYKRENPELILTKGLATPGKDKDIKSIFTSNPVKP
jgi:hypothetical protein